MVEVGPSVKSDEGVQTNEPLLSIFSAIGPTTLKLFAGPFMSTRVTVPDVVGDHCTLYGCPTGTVEPMPGAEIGLPTGPSPVGVV